MEARAGSGVFCSQLVILIEERRNDGQTTHGHIMEHGGTKARRCPYSLANTSAYVHSTRIALQSSIKVCGSGTVRITGLVPPSANCLVIAIKHQGASHAAHDTPQSTQDNTQLARIRKCISYQKCR